MPLSQDDVAVAIVDLADGTTQVPITSGSAVIASRLGMIAMGVTPAGTASYLPLDASGILKVTGSFSSVAAGTQTVTGSVTVANTPTVTGSISVLNVVTVTGSLSTTVTNTSVAGTGTLAPYSATLMGGKSRHPFINTNQFVPLQLTYILDNPTLPALITTLGSEAQVGGPGSSFGTAITVGGYYREDDTIRMFQADEEGNIRTALGSTTPLNGTAPISGSLVAGILSGNLLTAPAIMKTKGVASFVTSPVERPETIIFDDQFQGTWIDQTTRWFGVQTLQATGSMTSGSVNFVVSSSSATAQVYLISQPTFAAYGNNDLTFATSVKVDATTAITGTHRFWGFGNPGLTAIDYGYGFYLDGTGSLKASIFRNGANLVFQQTLTKPSDGAFHRYYMTYRFDSVYWYIDDLTVPVASASYVGMVVAPVLPALFFQWNTTLLSGTPTFQFANPSVGLRGTNTLNISDATYPWRRASVNPNGTLNISAPDGTGTATLIALNSVATVNMSGCLGVGMQLNAGTLIGTIIAENSVDGGTTWMTGSFYDPNTRGMADSIIFGGANTAMNRAIVTPQGTGLTRVRVSAYTSGQAGVTLRATQASNIIAYSSPIDGRRQTYSATAVSIAPAATATDVFTIGGSATKLIRIMKLEVWGTQTTAGGGITVLLLKRSTANSGGTSASATIVPHDSANAAATATAVSYTANPTTGSLVGNIRAIKALVPAPATVGSDLIASWDFGNRPSQAVVLNGTTQQLSVNLNSVTITGGSFTYWAEWTEE